jgi:hypothetical protein
LCTHERGEWVALLNLSKAKTSKKEEAGAEDVPDKLPALVEEIPQPTVVEEKKVVKPIELAPDELPPLVNNPPVSKSVTIEVPVEKPIERPPVQKIADERLYFARFMSRFAGDSVDPVQERLSGQDVMDVLHKNWTQQNQRLQVTDVNKKVVEMLAPLKALEQEWYILKNEVAQLENRLKERHQALENKERELKAKADELTHLLGSREEVARLLREQNV